MADESVRSLLATLGFEVDTTGADQFEARFKKLESTIKKLAKKIEAFDPKFKPGRAPKRAKTLGERIKKAFLKAMKLDPKKVKAIGDKFKKAFLKAMKLDPKKVKAIGDKFKKAFFKSIKLKPGGFKELTNSIKKGVSGAFKKARLTALAGAAALAATIGKGLLKFTDVESAKFALRFEAENLGVNFDKILLKLEDVKKNTKGVVDELGILQALNVGFQMTKNMDNVADNLEQVIKFASVLNKDASEIQQIISSFITTGETTGTRQLGFFTQEELEAQRRSGTGFETLSEKARTSIISIKLAEQLARLEKAFKKFGGTNAAFVAQVKTAASDALVDLGDEVTTGIRKVIESDSVIDLLKKGVEETKQEFISDVKAFTDFLGFTKKDASTAGGANGSSTIIQQTATIHINGITDPVAVGKAVDDRLNKKVKDAMQTEIRKTPVIAQ